MDSCLIKIEKYENIYACDKLTDRINGRAGREIGTLLCLEQNETNTYGAERCYTPSYCLDQDNTNPAIKICRPIKDNECMDGNGNCILIDNGKCKICSKYAC